MSRTVAFPAFLCSVAEQVYFAACDRGWGANDDAGIVRLWTSTPVSSIDSSSLSASDKEAKLQLIVDLLTGIHLVSAAEAISLAKHVGIPLSQLYTLAKDAAGGSKMFEQAGAQMVDILEGKESGDGKVLGGYVEKLRLAVNEIQQAKIPTYLGTGALNLLLQSGSELSLGALLKVYVPK